MEQVHEWYLELAKYGTGSLEEREKNITTKGLTVRIRYHRDGTVQGLVSFFILFSVDGFGPVGFWLGFPLKPASYCNLHFHSPKGILLCTNPLVLFY